MSRYLVLVQSYLAALLSEHDAEDPIVFAASDRMSYIVAVVDGVVTLGAT